MTRRRPSRPPAARSRMQGFTLLNVLVAAVIFGVGLLGIMRAFMGVTSAASQNQNVSTMATLSNAFEGVVQANPGLLTSAQFTGTFTSANIAQVPPSLQPWMTQATNSVTASLAASQAGTFGLPAGTVTIATGANPATGTACAPVTGCFVTLTIQWQPVGVTGVLPRAQTFYYLFQ